MLGPYISWSKSRQIGGRVLFLADPIALLDLMINATMQRCSLGWCELEILEAENIQRYIYPRHLEAKVVVLITKEGSSNIGTTTDPSNM